LQASLGGEATIYDALRTDHAETDPGDVAELLVRVTAEEVSARFPGALVIGAEPVEVVGAS